VTQKDSTRLIIQFDFRILHVIALSYTRTIAAEAINVLYEQLYPVQNCSTQFQILHLAFTIYEDLHVKSQLVPGLEGVKDFGNVLWLYIGIP
jgi:hypothetical protein